MDGGWIEEEFLMIYLLRLSLISRDNATLLGSAILEWMNITFSCLKVYHSSPSYSTNECANVPVMTREHNRPLNAIHRANPLQLLWH